MTTQCDEYISKIDNLPNQSFNPDQREIAKLILQNTPDDKLDLVYRLITQRVKTGFTFDEAPEVNHNAIALVREKPSLNINIPSLNTIEHKLIIGDNYDALKNLCATYIDSQGNGLINIIYIDPPYNTEILTTPKKKDTNKTKSADIKSTKFIYRDKFSGDGWLNMMNERLKMAHRLLCDSGVIFISIDDREQAYLKILCDEIFGADNFIGSIARVSKAGGNKGDLLKPKKDYILVYAKNVNRIDKNRYGTFEIIAEPQWQEEIFNDEKRLFTQGEIPYRAKLDPRPNQRYYIECPDGSLILPPGKSMPKIAADGEMIKPADKTDKCWTWSRDRYLDEKKNNRFIFKESKQSPFIDQNGKQSKWTIYKKKFKTEYLDGTTDDDDADETFTRRVILTDYLDEYQNSAGTRDLNALGLDFDYPKPVKLIKYLISVAESNNNGIILDFFAGSGTTGQAVMELNAEDNGTRKFILVNNNENKIGENILRERLYRVITGHGTKGEQFKWTFTPDRTKAKKQSTAKYLDNNAVRVFDIDISELTLTDLAKAEKIKEQAKKQFVNLNEKYKFKNDINIYNELAALNPHTPKDNK